MRFGYYQRLSPRDRATYRRSDALAAPPIPDVDALTVLLEQVESALDSGDARKVSPRVRGFCDGLLDQLGVPRVRIRVARARPADAEAELHGLYEREDDESARITVWMRTAVQGRVVAYRTFVRTLVHELCHHLDYDLHRLEDSFHTEGFFGRENALCRQLMGPGPERRRAAVAPEADDRQLRLFG